MYQNQNQQPYGAPNFDNQYGYGNDDIQMAKPYQNQQYNQNPGYVPQPPPKQIYIVQQNSSGNFCPLCQQQTETYISSHCGGFAWMMALLIWFFTCCCCWIACVVDRWQDRQFRCKRCHGLKYTRVGSF